MPPRGPRLARGARSARKPSQTSSGLPFVVLCRAVGLPEPEPEYRFHPTRKWRFDWAFVSAQIAVEQEGAVWTGGRHTRGAGFLKDLEKYNTAAALGWRVLRGTPQQIADGSLLPLLEGMLRRATE